jgi:hypothetical protein
MRTRLQLDRHVHRAVGVGFVNVAVLAERHTVEGLTLQHGVPDVVGIDFGVEPGVGQRQDVCMVQQVRLSPAPRSLRKGPRR